MLRVATSFIERPAEGAEYSHTLSDIRRCSGLLGELFGKLLVDRAIELVLSEGWGAPACA
jgi:hypothetical protein